MVYEFKMSPKDMIDTLQSTRAMQKPATPPAVPKQNTDIAKRERMKKYYFFKSLWLMLGIVGVVCLFFLLPVLVVNVSLFQSMFIGMPLMLFVWLAWMIPAWKFFDNRGAMFVIVMGAPFLKIVVITAFILFIKSSVPTVNFLVFIFSTMAYWVLFSIPLVMMMYWYTHHLDMLIVKDKLRV